MLYLDTLHIMFLWWFLTVEFWAAPVTLGGNPTKQCASTV